LNPISFSCIKVVFKDVSFEREKTAAFSPITRDETPKNHPPLVPPKCGRNYIGIHTGWSMLLLARYSLSHDPTTTLVTFSFFLMLTIIFSI
jgi:hypothetical protein